MIRNRTVLSACLLLSLVMPSLAAGQATETPEIPSAAVPNVEGPALDTPASEAKESDDKPAPAADAEETSQRNRDTGDQSNKAQETPAERAGSKLPAAPATTPAPRVLTPAMTALRDRVRRTLSTYYRQTLNTQESTVSDVLNLCLAFGCQSEVLCPAAGGRINAVTCLCWNYRCAGFEPLLLSEGHVAARLGFGLQEQPGEFLAVLAQSRVERSYPIRASQAVRSVADLVQSEKLGIRSAPELSLPLIGLACYVEEPTWKNDLGEEWSIERIVREELERPVTAARNGGTTRLMGLSYAVDRRLKRRQPIEGEFLRAQKFIAEFQDFALAHQNADGTWGPYFFAAKASSRDPGVQLRATGHVLEWLAFSLPESQLEDARLVRAVQFLSDLLANQRYQGSLSGLSAREVGSLMHGLHALAIYNERIFVPADPEKADKPESNAKKSTAAGGNPAPPLPR